jgi:hypothetical protein
MDDLDIPAWCNGRYDEFIHVHRSLLDSDLVSNELNHWIDLIFGFKLSGDAALEAKNICSNLIEANQAQFKVHGVVQLFKTAHPMKIDFILVNKNEEFPQKTRRRTDDIKNPIKFLDDVENMLRFVHLNYQTIPDLANNNVEQDNVDDKYFKTDLKYAILVLAELLLFDRIKNTQQTQSTLAERTRLVVKNICHLPRFLQAFITNSLHNTDDLSIDLLLNKNFNQLFNFNYFDDLYRLFEYFYKANFINENFFRLKFVNLNNVDLYANDKLNGRYLRISGDYTVEHTSLTDLLNEQKFFLTKRLLPSLLIKMSYFRNTYMKQTHFFELLMLLVYKNLFETPTICLKSILYFFDKLARFMTVNELNRSFLNILLELLNFIDLNLDVNKNRTQLCKLFDVKFIRSLKISFGLNMFLIHIVRLYSFSVL